MEEKELYPKLVEKLSKDYSLSRENLPATNDLSIIKDHLINRITELLSKDYQRFVNSLYMLDVKESKVAEIMSSKDFLTVPQKLADLIIDRQLQRIRTQILYKEGKI